MNCLFDSKKYILSQIKTNRIPTLEKNCRNFYYYPDATAQSAQKKDTGMRYKVNLSFHSTWDM